MMEILGFMNIHEGNTEGVKKAHRLYRLWSDAFYIYFMFCSLYNLYEVRGDVLQMTTTLTGSVATFGIYAKSLSLRLQAHRIRNLQSTLNNTLSAEIHARDLKTYEKAAKEMQRYFRLIYLLILLLLSLWVISGLISSIANDRKTYPLPVYIIWDSQWIPLYVFACLHQVYGAFLVGLQGVTINLIIFGSVAQLCTEYEVVEKNVLLIGRRFENRECRLLTKEENWRVKELLVKYIKHHQGIIDGVYKVESFYAHIFLFQFILTGSLGSLLFVEMILVVKTIDSNSIVPGVFFLLLCVDIYFFCWFGTRLKNKSFDFLNAVYSLPWIVMDAENRHLIEIILLKAQRPPKLTIEKISDVDFGSLLELSKMVYNLVYLVIQLSSNHE